MRPSHFVAAAMTGAASLVSADMSSTSCDTTSTSITTASSYVWPTSWPAPTPNSTSSFSTLSDTITYVTGTTSASGPGITPYTSNTTSAAAATSTLSTVSGSGATTPSDGLSGDRSVLGLVIFVALSLCLL